MCLNFPLLTLIMSIFKLLPLSLTHHRTRIPETSLSYIPLTLGAFEGFKWAVNALLHQQSQDLTEH